MLRDAGKQDKAEIYELWKQSYPNQNRNYLNFYFKNIFDKGRCIALEQDQRIISSLQLNEHILRLRDKQLKISYILGVSTLPDYRRRGHMRRLMESALDEAGHNHLVTLIRGFYPKLYEQFGFETVYERKLYTVPRECLHKVSLTNISYAAEPQELFRPIRILQSTLTAAMCVIGNIMYFCKTKLWLHRSRWWYIGTGRGRFAAI